jgi:hypothetical protein
VKLSWASGWVDQLNYGLEIGFIEGQFGCLSALRLTCRILVEGRCWVRGGCN